MHFIYGKRKKRILRLLSEIKKINLTSLETFF